MSPKVKHYQLRGAENPNQPFMLFGVRIDLHDVRSGYSGTDFAFFAGPWMEDDDLHWTSDMVQRLGQKELEEIAPPAVLQAPPFDDDKIIRYLTHYYRPQLWKNFDLGLYSDPQEDKEDFIQRCAEDLREERRDRLQSFREVFLHRFFEIEQKLLRKLREGEWEFHSQQRRISHIRTLFYKVRDDLTRSFLRDDFSEISESDFDWDTGGQVEFQERLEDLRHDFVERYNEINRECMAKARRVESYDVPLHYSQVDIVEQAVLWQ